MTWASNCASNLRSSADLRTDDARSASPDSEQIEPAGAEPLRRNSVSVEQIQEESSNAHHKRDDDICYHLFYFECFDSENLLLKFERGASRVRRIFAKRTKFFEAKSVDTFNASDSRQSSNAHHKKPNDICYPVFYFVVLMTWTSNCASNLRSSADLRTYWACGSRSCKATHFREAKFG